MKKVQMFFSAVLAVALIVSGGNFASAEGGYHYVYVANWGSDNNTGTEGAPLRSLREAFSRTVAIQPNRISILGDELVLDALLEDPTGHNRPSYRVEPGDQVSITAPTSSAGNVPTRVKLTQPSEAPLMDMRLYARNGRLLVENVEFSHIALSVQPSQGGTLLLDNIYNHLDFPGAGGRPVILANSNSGSVIIEDSEIGYDQVPFELCENPEVGQTWHRLIFYNKGTEQGQDSLWLTNNHFTVPTYERCYFRVVDDFPSYPGAWISAVGNELTSLGSHLHDEAIGFLISTFEALNDVRADNDFTQFWGVPLIGS